MYFFPMVTQGNLKTRKKSYSNEDLNLCPSNNQLRILVKYRFYGLIVVLILFFFFLFASSRTWS